MDVAVLGAGSIGSLLGGLLAREHPVTLVGRETHVTAVRRDGLTVTGRLECTVHPEARTDTAGLDADLVLVTVTAHDVSAAADQLARDADPAVVVPLSNGLGHADTLADRLPGATALAGTTTYGATLDRPGHVTCTGVGTVTVGARDGGPSRRAREVAAVFETAGVEATAANRSSMRQDLDAGRRTEVDAINGHVVDRAGAHDLAVPTNETLTRLLRLWERGRGLRR